MADSRMKYQETGDGAIRNQVKRTQNTFLHSVKASLFKGFQREATFYYPNYWGDMPMAVYSFLEKFDWSKKTVYPFCTHEGSGLSGTEKKIQSVCGGAKVEKGLAVQGSGADQGRAAVEKWISRM